MELWGNSSLFFSNHAERKKHARRFMYIRWNSSGCQIKTHRSNIPFLVGGFNPFEKYVSKWESSPIRSENKKYLKPPLSEGLSKLLNSIIKENNHKPQ